MAKKAKAAPEEFTTEVRRATTDTMLELAFRNSEAEGLMMRVANAAGFHEVTAEIKRRRLYGKKMGLVRSGDNSAGEPLPDADTTPRKKRSKKRSGKGSEGSGSDS